MKKGLKKRAKGQKEGRKSGRDLGEIERLRKDGGIEQKVYGGGRKEGEGTEGCKQQCEKFPEVGNRGQRKRMEIMKEKRKQNKEEGNSGLIMNQYGNTLPPIKLEKKSEVPERVSGQDQINPQKKVKSKPLPNNNDLKELEPLYDPVKIIKKQQVKPLKLKNQKEESRSPVQNNFLETRRGSYKPYSLKEYREKEVGSKTYRMGGLGANIGSEEWEKQNSKLQVMKQFSSRVKVSNKTTLESMPKKRREPVKEVSKLEKALKFAKNVPKPKPAMPKMPKVIKEKKSIDQLKDDFINGLDAGPEEPKQYELEELNQKHENFVNEVNEIKKLFM